MTSTPDHFDSLREDSLQLAHHAVHYAYDRIAVQEVRSRDVVRVTLVAMAVRLCRSQEAVCMLVAERLNDAAAAVMRSAVEQHFLFKAVNMDPTNLRLASEEAASERVKALKGLSNLSHDERADEVTDEAISEQLSQIEAKRTYSVHEWARVTGELGTFNTLWRSLCTYAHGSLVAIDRYLDVAPDGAVRGLNVEVERVSSIGYVITSTIQVLEALSVVDTAPSSEAEQARFATLKLAAATLHDRFCALPTPGIETAG